MERFRLETMRQGWFVGNFHPTAFQTEACEVAWKRHEIGETCPKHVHRQVTEINLLVRGQMSAKGAQGIQRLQEGDIFVLRPGEWIEPEFHTDCHLVVVKIPGIQGDKVLLP